MIPVVPPDRQHRDLLATVARLRERHQAGTPTRFNVFTVLRKPSDENHLHSRFLHALLDCRDSATGRRANLADFVHKVARVPNFKTETAYVYRESDRIDLLIANDVRQAIVLENKIHASDQAEQLQRYYRTLVRRRGYDKAAVHLLYLTLFGTPPTDQSIGPLGHRLRCLSYRDNLPDWLARCQQRAFDDPPLRETIAQYLDLVRQLTGTDYNGKYMNELKNLCKTDDNMLLARDLSRAFAQAEIDLVVQLWDTIDRTLGARVPDLCRDPEYEYLAGREDVAKTVTGKQRHESGLHYRVADQVWITVAATDSLWYGVYCDRTQEPDTYGRLKDILDGVGPTHYTASWTPWGCTPEPRIDIRDPTDSTLELLASEQSVGDFAARIAEDVALLWDALKSEGLPAV